MQSFLWILVFVQLLLIPGLTAAQTIGEPVPSVTAVGETTPVLTDATPPVEETSEYISLQAQDQDLREVIRSIAQMSGVNIILAREVAGRVNLELKDVYFEKALELVAESNGYNIYHASDSNTYLIGPQEGMPRRADRGGVQSIPLTATAVGDVLAELQELYPVKESDIRFAADRRTNTLLFRAGDHEGSGLPSVLAALDRRLPDVNFKIALFHQAGNDGKEVPQFGFDLTGRAGETLRISRKAPREPDKGKKNPDGIPVEVELAIDFRIAPDGGILARLEVIMEWAGDSVFNQKLQTALTLREGQITDIFRFHGFAAGENFILRVTPEFIR